MSVKILYVARLDLSHPTAAGVAYKIRAQSRALARGLGGEVIIATPQGGRVAIEKVADGTVKYSTEEWEPRRLHAYGFYGALASAVKDEANKRKGDVELSGVPDVVYLRYQRVSPPLLIMLRSMRRANPSLVIIVETPTWPVEAEARGLRSRALILSDRACRRGLKYLVNYVVTYSRHTEILGIPALPINNGIDASVISPRPRSACNEPFRLLGLANLSFWHGYDRVIEGLARNRDQGGPPVFFEVVGSGAEFEPLQKLAHDLNLVGPDKPVRFHGSLTGPALEAIERTCHVGIASIGMHRLDIDASVLKAREFCAKGMPFVIGYPDQDFPAHFKYALQIPGTDEPVSIPEIVAFFASLTQTDPEFALHMTEYAMKHLTWDTKMQPVAKMLSALHKKEA